MLCARVALVPHPTTVEDLSGFLLDGLIFHEVQQGYKLEQRGLLVLLRKVGEFGYSYYIVLAQKLALEQSWFQRRYSHSRLLIELTSS